MLYGKCQIIKILLLLIISVMANISNADTQTILELTVIDAAADDKIPARLRLRDENGKDHIPDGTAMVPILEDKCFVSEGFTRLKIAPGTINIRAERGTEYCPVMANITVAPGETTRHTIKMKRWINMKEPGYSRNYEYRIFTNQG